MLIRNFVVLAALGPVAVATHAEAADMLPAHVEHSKPLPRPRTGLGTAVYKATEREKRETKDWKPGDVETGGVTTETLLGKKDKRISWFGIVRGVKEDDGKTLLHVEMKYFDGLTDSHQQIVSLRGAGDFQALVPGTGHRIKPLGLACVYGVVRDEQGGEPVVEATYVRYWEWGLFAFMDYGTDHSKPQWVELRRIDPDDVYSSDPDQAYYEKTIGRR